MKMATMLVRSAEGPPDAWFSRERAWMGKLPSLGDIVMLEKLEGENGSYCRGEVIDAQETDNGMQIWLASPSKPGTLAECLANNGWQETLPQHTQ